MKEDNNTDISMTIEDRLLFCMELINLSNDAIFVVAPETSRLLYVNDMACKNLGYTGEELLSMHVTDFEDNIPNHKSWINHVTKVRETGSLIMEGNHKRRDKTIFPVEVSIRYVERPDMDYMVVMVRDISDRKKAETELKNEKDRLINILDNMDDGAYIVNQTHDIEYINPVIKREFGNDISKKCYDFFYGRNTVCPWCKNKEVFKGKSVKWEFTFEDKQRTYELFDMPIRNADGTISKFEIFHDISERRRAEAALIQSEKRFRTLVETIPYGIQENDNDGNVTFSNDSHCKILGYTRDEMQGKPIGEFLRTEEERINLRQLLKHLIKEQPVPSPHITKNRTKDGSIIDVKVDWNYKRNSAGDVTGFIAVITDITEQIKAEEARERLQAQLLHSQKMEAIGRLAGGIAHDFGNILTAISNFSSLGIKGTRESAPYACNIFDHINTASFRAMNLIRQLLTFSRKDFTRIVNTDLNKIINDLFDMLNHIIGEDINIVTECGSGLWSISGDSGKLEQVITNLIVNSRDAMPGGGTITIRTGNIVIDNAERQGIPYSREGQFVRLSVEDTGVGISRKNMDHIFEPFFTTKKSGFSSGLGLSVVYAIINDHKGWINVKSEEGAGTIFEVYLPAVADSCEPCAEKKLSEESRGIRGERILLVEDDSIVRISTRMALEKEGYEVFEAENSAEALKIFQEENGRFNIVMSDLILPGHNGLHLIKELLKINPGLKAILNSGYIDKPIDKSEIEKSGILFLSKPYDIKDVLTAIREIMNKH
ncbi:MAG: PAS domain S-box protein [Nitrospirae bacterium]|nr:PAS domain S-box protein [Nitrospirota bacterium]